MSDNDVLDSHAVDSELIDTSSDNVPMLKRRLLHAQKNIEFLQGFYYYVFKSIKWFGKFND